MRTLPLFALHRRGFSLVEAMIAVTLVTVACSAILLSVGQAMQASESGFGTSRANLLAQELMNEISACRWADQKEPAHWGPESDEVTTKTRSAFDDLDDYDGWTGPPQTRGGQDYDSLQNRLFPDVSSHDYSYYTCSVRVEYVSSTGQVLMAGKTSVYRRVDVEVTRLYGNHPPHTLSRIFQDLAPVLGRSNWFDPNAVEPVAQVKIVP